MNNPPVRILVAADDPLTRAGLAALLADRADCAVVGQVASDDAANLAAALDIHRPDAVALDLGWSDGEIADSLADVVARGVPLVVLAPDVGAAAHAWRAGARAILPRDASAGDLEVALRAAVRGLSVVHPDFTAFGGSALNIVQAPFALPEVLTPREADVLKLLSAGATNKAIAHALGISENTVKFHVNAIFGKLGASSRTEATVLAARLGLIAL